MLSRSFVRLLTVATTAFSTAFAAIYEAEAGTLSGTTVLTELAGFSGTGYVGGFDESADSLTFTVPITTAGLYDLKLRYAGIYGSKVTSMSLNGGGGGDVSLPETTTWATAGAGQALLNAGTNTIKFTNNWGWYLIDYLEVTPSAPRAPHKVQNTLVNTASTSATKSLFSYLLSNYGSKILSGQQEISSITWVEQNVGKTPAVAGLDLMDYTPSRVERGTVGTSINEAIAWDTRGGIVTLCWHWNAPNGLIDTAGKEWYRGFYTEATTFDISAAMADTTNANYQLLIRDIDAIAVELKKLQDANIPVLWRPLHEAEGGWFWWGAKGAEPCKKLYRVLYDRLTNYHKLNNLIWVWNSINPTWYPGSDVVDVVSFDSYPAAGDHNPLSSQFDQLVSLTNDTKLIAVTEVGSMPDPALIQAYGLRWSWWCTWSGDYISGGSQNSLSFLQSAYNHASVINLDGLPANWKNYGGSTTTTTKTTTSTTTTKTTTTPTPTSTTKTTTTTTKTTSTTATPTATKVAQKWEQCGGVNWTGPTTCVSGTTCTAVSPPYYYQCL